MAISIQRVCNNKRTNSFEIFFGFLNIFLFTDIEKTTYFFPQYPMNRIDSFANPINQYNNIYYFFHRWFA